MLDLPSIAMASYSFLEFKYASAAMNEMSNANLMLKPFFWGCISLSTPGSAAACSSADALPASDFILVQGRFAQTRRLLKLKRHLTHTKEHLASFLPPHLVGRFSDGRDVDGGGRDEVGRGRRQERRRSPGRYRFRKSTWKRRKD